MGKIPGIGAVFFFGNVAQKFQFLFYENKIKTLIFCLTIGVGGSIIKEPKGKTDGKNKIAERQKEVIIMTKLNGYKVVNESNSKEETKVFQSEADQVTFDDAVYQIKIGHWAVLPDWDAVENILDCFDNNDDFIIEQVGNTFYVGKPESNRVLNRLEKLKEAFAKGEIFEIDER